MKYTPTTHVIESNTTTRTNFEILDNADDDDDDDDDESPTKQPVAPPAAKVYPPPAQISQVSAPVSAEYVPAEQFEQLEAAVEGENFPAVHFVQEEDLSLLVKVPLGQALQVEGQGELSGWSEAAVVRPIGHATQ